MFEIDNGAEALAAATEHRPDVILMDIQLPLLDGYEATRRIKADPALKHIPIIVVTSYALSGDETKARRRRLRCLRRKALQPTRLAGKNTPICALTILPGKKMHQPARRLIVDDNRTNRDILATRLATQGSSSIKLPMAKRRCTPRNRSCPTFCSSM